MLFPFLLLLLYNTWTPRDVLLHCWSCGCRYKKIAWGSKKSWRGLDLISQPIFLDLIFQPFLDKIPFYNCILKTISPSSVSQRMCWLWTKYFTVSIIAQIALLEISSPHHLPFSAIVTFYNWPRFLKYLAKMDLLRIWSKYSSHIRLI
jgi:hypothetical protein